MGKFDDLPEVRRKGLEKMEQVYGFEMNDMEGDFFHYTADHLFGDIWQRPGLSDRDRRLVLIGMLAGQGAQDVLSIQIPAAYATTLPYVKSSSCSATTPAGRSERG
jgi:4-carboxymuconolactone decarboxylase